MIRQPRIVFTYPRTPAIVKRCMVYVVESSNGRICDMVAYSRTVVWCRMVQSSNVTAVKRSNRCIVEWPIILSKTVK